MVCSTDREVDRLKPDPTGLFVTAKKLQVAVENCLYVGDRDEKDGACARNAGMKYLILDRKIKKMPYCVKAFPKIKAWIVENMDC